MAELGGQPPGAAQQPSADDGSPTDAGADGDHDDVGDPGRDPGARLAEAGRRGVVEHRDRHAQFLAGPGAQRQPGDRQVGRVDQRAVPGRQRGDPDAHRQVGAEVADACRQVVEEGAAEGRRRRPGRPRTVGPGDHPPTVIDRGDPEAGAPDVDPDRDR